MRPFEHPVVGWWWAGGGRLLAVSVRNPSTTSTRSRGERDARFSSCVDEPYTDEDSHARILANEMASLAESLDALVCSLVPAARRQQQLRQDLSARCKDILSR